jgi:hypothetical protein
LGRGLLLKEETACVDDGESKKRGNGVTAVMDPDLELARRKVERNARRWVYGL